MRYLIIAWPFGLASEAGRALCERVARETEWRVTADLGGVRVFALERDPPSRLYGDTTVVGRVYPRSAGKPPMARVRRPDNAARDLVDNAWGSYVAVVRDEAGRPRLLNDPIGHQECLVWRLGDVVLASSEVPNEPTLRPTDLAIDWTVLAAHLPNLSLAPEAAPITGVTTVAPGCLYDPWSGTTTRLWSPAAVAGKRGVGFEATASGLRDVVESTVAKLAQGRRRMVCDISGGLDSAIVASALARVGSFSGYHQRFAEAEADEALYAQAVADRHGAALTIEMREPLTWSAELIEASADGARPSTNAIDSVFDQQLAAHLRHVEADALFTGHGGDAVFFQHPDPGLILQALFGSRGGRSRLETAGNIAFRMRKSFPRLILDGLAARRGGQDVQTPAWLALARGLPAARRTQIRAILYARHRFGRALRARAAPLVDPLMAQPVVEWCLQAPVLALTGGDIDRTLAREAFAEDLPVRIATRARKGDVSVFFGKSLLASRVFLRDYLLGGRLRQAGLLNAEEVEAALDPQALLYRNVMAELLPPMAAEAWVRVTERRLAH